MWGDWWRNWWQQFTTNWSGGSGGEWSGQTASVPEIDASAGLLALAAVGAALLFAWERRRRDRG
jgi:hypothetical protein